MQGIWQAYICLCVSILLTQRDDLIYRPGFWPSQRHSLAQGLIPPKQGSFVLAGGLCNHSLRNLHALISYLV